MDLAAKHLLDNVRLKAEEAAALAVALATGVAASVALLQAIGANANTAIDTSGGSAALTQTFTTGVTTVTGSAGVFVLSGQMRLTAGTPGDEVVFTLMVNGSPVGTPVSVIVDTNNIASASGLAFATGSLGAGNHNVAVRATCAANITRAANDTSITYRQAA